MKRTTVHETYLMAKSKFFNEIVNQKDSTRTSSKRYYYESRSPSQSLSRDRSRDKRSKYHTKNIHNILDCPCLQKEIIRKLIGSKRCNCCESSK